MMEKVYQDILSLADSYAQEQLDFVIDLCDENSHTHNKEGVNKVGGMIADRLESILPDHKVLEQKSGGDHHVFETHNSSKAIYLVGHIDTVFPPDHPFQKCKINGDILNGPGSGDMKGGLAVIIYALRVLQEIGLLGGLRLVVLFNSDEEIGSVTSQPLFMRERSNAIACIGAECAGLKNEIVVSRNGKLGARIDCYGKGRHVSDGTHEKSGAILELAHKIIDIESLNSFLPGVSINVGRIEGGLGPSTIAAHAFSLLDVRWVEESHKAILMDKIHTIMSTSSQKDCRSEFTVLNSRPAMPMSKATADAFQVIRDAGSALGQEIRMQHRRGTSDVNFFGSAGIPAVDGLGPICEHDHTPEEYIRISSLRDRTALLALFLLEYGKKVGMIN
jgi:glutamate carboxypeptidase